MSFFIIILIILIIDCKVTIEIIDSLIYNNIYKMENVCFSYIVGKYTIDYFVLKYMI